MSRYLDRISDIFSKVDEATKVELSEAVFMIEHLSLEEYDWAMMKGDLYESLYLVIATREDISESEFEKLMSGEPIAEIDELELLLSATVIG